MTSSYTPKRDAFYFFEGIYTQLVCRLLPTIAKTRITPNQVTCLNLINAIVISFCLLTHLYPAASLLIQLYLALDILDGNLARYAKLSSRFGQILDQISDRLFYTVGFIILGYSVGNPVTWLIAYAVTINLYAWVTTFYIGPRIRKLPNFKRRGIKKTLMQRKIIFGMDLSTQDVIASILLITPWASITLPAITALYCTDGAYRILELKRNEKAA